MSSFLVINILRATASLVVFSAIACLIPPANAQTLVTELTQETLVKQQGTAKELDGVEEKNITEGHWAVGGEYTDDIEVDESEYFSEEVPTDYAGEIESFSYRRSVDDPDSYDIQNEIINERLQRRVKEDDFRNSIGVAIIGRW